MKKKDSKRDRVSHVYGERCIVVGTFGSGGPILAVTHSSVFDHICFAFAADVLKKDTFLSNGLSSFSCFLIRFHQGVS